MGSLSLFLIGVTQYQKIDKMFNMFKPKMSSSPQKSEPQKRGRDSSQSSAASQSTGHNDDYDDDASNHNNGINHCNEPRFTFDEVKELIDRLLAKQTRASPAVNAGLKRVNFDEVSIDGHSVEGCKELIEQLVQNTRRVRTLREVLVDIKENLNKRTYTEIIHRSTLQAEAPRKPPSAYLLYNQERYNELRHENPLAREVTKIVAEEWKNLSDKKRREYQRRHDELMRKYEQEMQQLGLIDEAAPKRPKSAKTLYIESCLAEHKTVNWSKEKMAEKKDTYAQQFEQLSAEEKAQWNAQHKSDQLRYKREREEYMAAHPHLDHAIPEKRMRGSEKAKPPTPPKSAVKFYLEKKLPEDLVGKEYDETKKRLKDKFQDLSQKKLLKYVKKAVQDKRRYDAEVEEFKREHPGVEVPKTKANVTKEQWKMYARVVENRPTLPAPTAYLHYCSRMLSEMFDNEDEQIPTKRMQVASVAWKKSTDKEKKAAVRAHSEDVERYISEMEAWLESQPSERRTQVLTEEPKANPDYWRKKLNKMRKAEKKTTK